MLFSFALNTKVLAQMHRLKKRRKSKKKREKKLTPHMPGTETRLYICLSRTTLRKGIREVQAKIKEIKINFVLSLEAHFNNRNFATPFR